MVLSVTTSAAITASKCSSIHSRSKPDLNSGKKNYEDLHHLLRICSFVKVLSFLEFLAFRGKTVPSAEVSLANHI